MATSTLTDFYATEPNNLCPACIIEWDEWLKGVSNPSEHRRIEKALRNPVNSEKTTTLVSACHDKTNGDHNASIKQMSRICCKKSYKKATKKLHHQTYEIPFEMSNPFEVKKPFLASHITGRLLPQTILGAASPPPAA